MSTRTTIILCVLTLVLSMSWAFYHNQNNLFWTEDGTSWVSCGAGFFYDTGASTMEDVKELEGLALQCKEKKLGKRGSHNVVLDSKILITPAGTSITHTDDYMIDNILVINWEVNKEDHLAIAERYLLP